MVELVYTQDLKSCGLWPCGFKSRSWYQYSFLIVSMRFCSISFLDIVACIGSFTAVISLLPQIIQSYKTKSVDDVSMLMLLNLTVASVSWTLYGALTADKPLLVTNLLLTVGSLILVVLKRKYRST